MSDMQTDLSIRILERADNDKLPSDHELRDAAIAWDKAAVGFYAEPQTCTVKEFVGRWAKLRRLWCAYSGEALL